MHIPDGYLSPSTCAALYAAAAPFWATAMRRVRALLLTRFVPLLSLFAAFSFVIMMFNIPLPGGTTGHATGVGIAAVVLGPWGAILAVSVALIIQALLFGDGGITAIGANCFNIAIVGSLVAWGTYTLLARRAPLNSRRRAIAAGIAGYVAVNAAAFVTAIELGLQPHLFRDAAGAPLYAPYPLDVAIPAMMLGHITIAGLAELIVSAGVIAWLQKHDPALLKTTARDARPENEARALRPLWAGLCALVLATPLGLLAAGTAWGEWGADEFADPTSREAISAATRGAALPAGVPQGLQRLSSVWTAPIPDYAPAFLRSEFFGYLASAMLGVGVIIALTFAARRIAQRQTARAAME
jgi:cobalt/nickel transport system permease protein